MYMFHFLLCFLNGILYSLLSTHFWTSINHSITFYIQLNLQYIVWISGPYNRECKTLTFLAAENAIPEYAYLSTTNVTPLLINAFILDLKIKEITFKQYQSFWLQIQRSRVRFPALPDFLRGSGSGTGSTQPREYSW
jgi:hypothetical protein